MTPRKPLVLTVTIAALAGCGTHDGDGHLAAFGSREALERFGEELAAAQARATSGAPSGAYADTGAAPASGEAARAPGGGESITNNQELGVDEGDIVKAHGDHLVVLRRGRLFTVRVGDAGVAPVSRIDAFAPGATPAQWYDEMLVHGDTVLVLGYSYAARATEVNRFRIDAAGGLSYLDSFFLRSGDYYSSRNYATRVVGNQFVLYAPVPLFEYRHDGTGARRAVSLPALRRGHAGPWDDVADFSRVYRPLQSPGSYPLLHTVVFCDLARPTVSCHAEGVVGPWARTFYVSRGAVYLWINGPRYAAWPASTGASSTARPASAAYVYRFPLDGALPGAVEAEGGPIDQFSFREAGGELQVLVAPESRGDGFWGPERRLPGALNLARVPLGSFSLEPGALPAAAYTALPDPGVGYTTQNRFVGEHLLYGNGNTWVRDRPAAHAVYVHSLARRATTRLALPHTVDRLEALGSDAVVVGNDGADLHFTSLALDATPRIAADFVRRGAAQGETRSHGFFYKPDGDRSGILGLPVRGARAAGHAQLFETSAEVLYLRVSDLRLSPLGALRAEALATAPADACVTSCVDWYGNARPIFYRGRIFALLGYELVEGALRGGALAESGRTSFSPSPSPSPR